MICETSALSFNSFMPRAAFMGLLWAVSSCFEHLWNCPPSSQTLQDFPPRVGLEKEAVCPWEMQTHPVFLCPHSSPGIEPDNLFISFLIQTSPAELQRSKRRTPRGNEGVENFSPGAKRPEQGAGSSCRAQAAKQSTEPAEFLWIPWKNCLGLWGKHWEHKGRTLRGAASYGLHTKLQFSNFFSVYRDIKPLLERLNPTFLLLPRKLNDGFAQDKSPNP